MPILIAALPEGALKPFFTCSCTCRPPGCPWPLFCHSSTALVWLHHFWTIKDLRVILYWMQGARAQKFYPTYNRTSKGGSSGISCPISSSKHALLERAGSCLQSCGSSSLHERTYTRSIAQKEKKKKKIKNHHTYLASALFRFARLLLSEVLFIPENIPYAIIYIYCTHRWEDDEPYRGVE